jgi:uncharacterized membrane protein YgcG
VLGFHRNLSACISDILAGVYISWDKIFVVTCQSKLIPTLLLILNAHFGRRLADPFSHLAPEIHPEAAARIRTEKETALVRKLVKLKSDEAHRVLVDLKNTAKEKSRGGEKKGGEENLKGGGGGGGGGGTGGGGSTLIFYIAKCQ